MVPPAVLAVRLWGLAVVDVVVLEGAGVGGVGVGGEGHRA